MNSNPTPRVSPTPPTVCPVRELFAAFSQDTGLMELGASAEAARGAYEAALPERRPLAYAWQPEPVRGPAQFDFSEFHPLFHAAWAAECRRLPGGPRRHLRLWWDYQCEVRPADLVGRLGCRFGRHDETDWWRPAPDGSGMLNGGGTCRLCGLDRPRSWRDPRPPSFGSRPSSLGCPAVSPAPCAAGVPAEDPSSG